MYNHQPAKYEIQPVKKGDEHEKIWTLSLLHTRKRRKAAKVVEIKRHYQLIDKATILCDVNLHKNSSKIGIDRNLDRLQQYINYDQCSSAENMRERKNLMHQSLETNLLRVGI